MLNKKISAFTLAELLITMALTSMMITFCYMSYNYVQKLLYQFNDQSFFITRLNELDKRLHQIAYKQGTIVSENDNIFIFNCDSSVNNLELKKNAILLRRFNQVDTFRFSPEKITVGFENVNNPVWQNRLVNELGFDIYFQHQRFHFALHKNYDAVTKFNLEKEI